MVCFSDSGSDLNYIQEGNVLSCSDLKQQIKRLSQKAQSHRHETSGHFKKESTFLAVCPNLRAKS